MKKFKTLLEGVFRRYQGGSFLTGDVVKFREGAETQDWCNKQPSNIMEKIKKFMESDLLLRISSVKAIRPAASGDVQQDNQQCDYYCDIVQEVAPGMGYEFVTVPAFLLEINSEVDPGSPPVPDSLKRKDKTHIKPEKVDEPGANDGDTTKPFSQTRHTDKGNNNMSPADWRLPQENSPGKGIKWNDSEPGGGNYKTSIYMESLKKA